MSENNFGDVVGTNAIPQQAAIPAPPSAMLDIIIMQLEGAISSTPAPDYVKEACATFIESLKRWGKEGAN
jgi:hypothetical protein